MNKAASQLGKLGKGRPKNFTRAERTRRRKQMQAMNLARAKNGKVAGNSHQRRVKRREAR